jgi:zinc-finger of acetyl-transferase ESCO
MKAGLFSVCSIVIQEDSKPRQTSIRNFFGACTAGTKSTSSLPAEHSTLSPQEDRDTSCTDRTRISFNDTERNVEVAPPSKLCIGTLEHAGSIDDDKRIATGRMTKRKRTSTQPQQQLYLDFGQRNFATPIICATCGMLVVHGVAADVQRHESVCRNYQEGIPWNDSASLKPCWEWTLATKREMKNTSGTEGMRRDLTKKSRILRDHNGSSPMLDRACILEVSYDFVGALSFSDFSV